MSSYQDARLHKHLECPVCLNVRSGAILKCANDHLVCQSCYDALQPHEAKTCPTCRVRYPEQPKRSRLAERIIEDLELAKEEVDLADSDMGEDNEGESDVEELVECPNGCNISGPAHW